MIILCVVLLILLVGQLFVSYTNILAGPQLRQSGPIRNPVQVSVLIPARNEAGNIGRCLEGLLQQDYTSLEILVLDDHSEDNTAGVIARYATQHPNLQCVKGKALPQGWTGKNWACHQLSELATGDILIFTDADNYHEPEAVSRTVGWMQQYHLGMFSAFPQQITKSFSEHPLVPMIDVMVYSLLPLWAVLRCPAPSLSAANGQWMAWTAAVYRSLGGHQSVRNEVVEDVYLARKAKQAGIRMATAAGTGVMFARMYRSFRDIRDGLAKVLFGLAGYHDAVFLMVLPLVFLTAVIPYVIIWFHPFVVPAGIAILLNGLVRGGLAWRFRHPFILSILFHPVSVLWMLFLGFESYWRVKNGVIRWKGREIVLQTH